MLRGEGGEARVVADGIRMRADRPVLQPDGGRDVVREELVNRASCLALQDRAERVEVPVVVEKIRPVPHGPASRRTLRRVAQVGGWMIDAGACREQVADGRVELGRQEPARIIDAQRAQALLERNRADSSRTCRRASTRCSCARTRRSSPPTCSRTRTVRVRRRRPSSRSSARARAPPAAPRPAPPAPHRPRDARIGDARPLRARKNTTLYGAARRPAALPAHATPDDPQRSTARRRSAAHGSDLLSSRMLRRTALRRMFHS